MNEELIPIKDAKDALVHLGKEYLHNSPAEDWQPPEPRTESPNEMSLEEWKDSIFYDRARKEYLIIDCKTNWFSVNETMLRRQCKVRGIMVTPAPGCVSSDFDVFMVHLQNHRGVAYAGPLAGHRKGLRTVNGAQILVTHEPLLIDPVAGEWSTLKLLLEGMFDDGSHDQLAYLYGWLRSSLECLRTRTRKPGQVLVIAGPAECGKSLLQTIITWILGGRECKPYAYMIGKTDFNSDLFTAEHLRLDDEQASVDMRARRAFGARIKELLFGHAQRMHAKHREALTLDPIWRMTISLNEEPEAMQVLPPLDESLEDKIIILRATKRPMPMPTRTTEQSDAFAAKLYGELPAFVHWLLYELNIPPAHRNERCGICHWHHPEMLIAISEMSCHVRLLALIDRELFHSQRITPQWEGTADELEHELTGEKSSVRTEISKVLNWNNACGTYLGRIAKDLPERVEYSRTSTVRKWVILPPSENT
jgi:hypothetical protein